MSEKILTAALCLNAIALGAPSAFANDWTCTNADQSKRIIVAADEESELTIAYFEKDRTVISAWADYVKAEPGYTTAYLGTSEQGERAGMIRIDLIEATGRGKAAIQKDLTKAPTEFAIRCNRG